MEKIDPKLQSRVWSRIQGAQPPPPPAPRFLLLEAENAALLQRISPHFPGNAPRIKALLTQCRENMALLQGIDLLRRGTKPQIPPITPTVNDPAAQLRKCYVNCLTLISGYDSAQTDPEYGVAYAHLAQAHRQAAPLFLSLLSRT